MYKCDFCNYTSDRKHNITLHNNIKHKENIIPIIDNNKNKCVKCNKDFSTKQYLKKHQFNCYGIINKLECQKCNKVFSSSSNKIRHTKTCKEIIKDSKIEVPPLSYVTNNNITNNNIINNNIINNTFIYNNDPNIHPLAYQNYTIKYLSNDVIYPNKNNLPLMIENFGRLIFKDNNNKYVKKTNCNSDKCFIKDINGDFISKLDKDIIPKVTKDIAYNFRVIIDDNEEEIFNINKNFKKIIPNLTDFLNVLVDYNLDLEILNEIDKEDLRLFNNCMKRITCSILDSSK
jgi:hypothetical protein